VKRGSRAGGERIRARRPKALKSKSRDGSKLLRRRGSTSAGQETEVARLTRELAEALERQTATAEVLNVISRSPADLAAVFEMAEHATPATCGVDHVGLSVRDLESTRRFFCDCLGWRVVGERPEYPAAFVSDGQQIVTLWRVEAPDHAVAFDRRTNVGLHHLALAVADRAGLDALYDRVASWPDVVVEFAPELSGKGPKMHFIVREPSGIRIEFAFDPRVERPASVEKTAPDPLGQPSHRHAELR
jgi:catechol 2,3-dioxygenase-like lactoylglutathione lyase family enzyme